MTLIAPKHRKTRLRSPQVSELAARYKVGARLCSCLVRGAGGFLPDLRDMYAFSGAPVVYQRKIRSVQFPCSLRRHLTPFLNSAEYRMLRDQFGNKEAATDEDAEKVIKTIISSHSLQQNISPHIFLLRSSWK